MNQQFCTLLNIVLVSRLVFLHRDAPLTFRRAIGMAIIQIAGLFLFQVGITWIVLAVALLALIWIEYDYERRHTNHDLGRLLTLFSTVVVASVFFSDYVGLQLSTKTAVFARSAGRYFSLIDTRDAMPLPTINLIVMGTLLVIAEANCIVRYMFRILKIEPSRATNPESEDAIDGDEYRAGRAIGILERTLIYLLVLKGQYAAIGIVLVAKGFTRFKELDERRFAEYVLIGTLLSTLLALLVGEYIRLVLP